MFWLYTLGGILKGILQRKKKKLHKQSERICMLYIQHSEKWGKICIDVQIASQLHQSHLNLF